MIKREIEFRYVKEVNTILTRTTLTLRLLRQMWATI